MRVSPTSLSNGKVRQGSGTQPSQRHQLSGLLDRSIPACSTFRTARAIPNIYAWIGSDRRWRRMCEHIRVGIGTLLNLRRRNVRSRLPVVIAEHPSRGRTAVRMRAQLRTKSVLVSKIMGPIPTDSPTAETQTTTRTSTASTDPAWISWCVREARPTGAHERWFGGPIELPVLLRARVEALILSRGPSVVRESTNEDCCR